MGKKYLENLREQSLGEKSGVYCEERDGVAPVQRINPYRMWRRGEKLNYEYEEGMPFYEQEKRGASNIFDLAVDGYKLIFWFSPKGGEYIDGRIVAARVKRVRGRDVELECRGLVVTESPEVMLKMAVEVLKNGGVSMDPINNSEDLRSQPIGINIEEDWCDFGEKITGMPEVWEAIRKGDDIKNKKYIERHILDVELELKRVGRENDVYLFERLMWQRGFRLNAIGNHGGSNYQGNVGGWFNSMFNNESIVLSRNDERLKHCDSCGLYYMKKKGKCPKCNKE